MKVKFKKTSEDSKLPVKGNEKAACYDCYANSIETLGNKVSIGLGFSTEIPPGYKINIVPRSNLVKYNWVLNNSPCQIDEDYRGEYKIMFTAIPDGLQVIPFNGIRLRQTDFPYKEGERVAQMYLEKVEDLEIEEVDSLEDSQRGSGGFGSTGKY